MSTRTKIKRLREAIEEFKASENGKGVCMCGDYESSHSPWWNNHEYVDSHEYTLDLLEKEYSEQREIYLEKEREYGRRYRAKKNTGTPKGRRRDGEPPSDNYYAVSARRYRKDNEKWKEYNRRKQAEWRAKNPERAREIARESALRRKLRDKAARTDSKKPTDGL